MGKTTNAVTRVSDYRLSIWFGWVLGRVDRIAALYVNDRIVPMAEVTFNTTRRLNSPNLFGGPQEGGGIDGYVDFFLGAANQVAPIRLSSSLGIANENCPGFRGYLSTFFRGQFTSDVQTPAAGTDPPKVAGFKWSTNNPVIPAVKLILERSPKGLTADAGGPVISGNANPAHIIWECLTDTDFGMGASPALLDEDSFVAAAEKLRTENFGLAFLWSNSTSIEEFISEVLDHILALLSVDPTTGKLYLKLLREDYDVNTLFTLTPDNADFDEFQRTAWGETANEITVSWTNPANEEASTFTIHDQANFDIQGGVVSSARNYYGVRGPALAGALALREIRASGTPLVALKATVSRTAWRLLPGDVVKITWPEYGINQLIMRVGPINYGKPGDPFVVLDLVEDIFGLPLASFTPPDTEHNEPGDAATVLDYVYMGAIPYYVYAGSRGDSAAQAVVFPETAILLLAAEESLDTSSVDFLVLTTNALGQPEFAPAGNLGLQGRATLAVGMVYGAEKSILPPLTSLVGPAPVVGGFILVHAVGDQSTQEIMLVEQINEAGVTVRRGCLDTVPREWPAGAVVWCVDPSVSRADFALRSEGAEITYKFLPITSQGRLDESLAPAQPVTLESRFHLPYRPANLRVEGEAFGPTHVAAADTEVTWSRRNRLTETTLVLAWTDADTLPETGQTVTLQIEHVGVGVLDTYTGITGTTFTLPLGSFPGLVVGEEVILRAWSVRDGLDSYTTVEHRMVIVATLAGYGRSYGNVYGGYE